MNDAHLALGVAEDDGLGDGESVVQVAQSVKLPLLPLHSHEELLDTLQSQLVTLHQDPDGVRHELGGHLQDLVRQGGGDEANLCCWGQVPVHIIDLLLEPLVQHLISLVQHQHLDASCSQCPPPDHVEHTARSTTDHVLTIVQLPDVLAQVGASDAGVTLDVHVVSQRQDNLLNLNCQLSSGGQTQNLKR